MGILACWACGVQGGMCLTVSNTILCSTKARSSSVARPCAMSGRTGAGMRATSGASMGACTSPWRGVSSTSRSIRRTTTQCSMGKSAPSPSTSTSRCQSNPSVHKVRKLIAMHIGLIQLQTNREGGLHADQWQKKRWEDGRIGLSEDERQGRLKMEPIGAHKT